jgi:multiple sugar transport system permease protein
MRLSRDSKQLRPAKWSGGAALTNRSAIGFVFPAAVGIVLFLMIPAVWTLYLGFTDYRLTGIQAANKSFVGLANYRTALTDPGFLHSLRITIIFVFFSAIIGQALFGFIIAWVFSDRPGRLRSFVEVIIILAWIIPSSVVTFLWFAFLNGQQGTLNKLLGIHVEWLLHYPMLSIIVFDSWRGAAFSVLLFGAAIAAIPKSHLEVARVAGASRFRQLRDIVIPASKGYILTNLLLISLWTFNLFTPFLLTRGGPGNATEILPVFVYNKALRFFDFGYGSAISAIMLMINLVFALIVIRRGRKIS